jgi:hypothetical protein
MRSALGGVVTVAERLARIADALPDDASSVVLTRAGILAMLAEQTQGRAERSRATDLSDPSQIVPEPRPEAWSTRLWTAPDEQRLGVLEVAEALGRSKSWVYRATSKEWAERRGRAVLPHSKLDGLLTFRAGAVRAWLRVSERVAAPEPRHLRAIP